MKINETQNDRYEQYRGKKFLYKNKSRAFNDDFAEELKRAIKTIDQLNEHRKKSESLSRDFD